MADDLRAALSASAGAGPDGLGHRLARSLGHLAYARRFLAEAIAHNEAAAARAPDPGQGAADLRAAAHVALAAGRGDTAFGLLLEAADRASAAGDERTKAAVLAYAVIVADRFAGWFTDEVPHDRLRELLESAARAAPPDDPEVAALLAAARAWNATGEKDSPDPELAAEALAEARRGRRSGADQRRAGRGRRGRAGGAGQLRESYRLIQERALLLDRLPRHDPRAGAEIVDTLHAAADSAAIIGDLPAALASARRGQGDSIVIGRHDLTLGMEVVPLVLQGKFDVALDHAADMWDEWQREGRPASRWIAPASYAAVLAHGLRGDEPGRQLWLARVSELVSTSDPTAIRGLAGFAAFADARIALHRGDLERAAEARPGLGIGPGSLVRRAPPAIRLLRPGRRGRGRGDPGRAGRGGAPGPRRTRRRREPLGGGLPGPRRRPPHRGHRLAGGVGGGLGAPRSPVRTGDHPAPDARPGARRARRTRRTRLPAPRRLTPAGR